MYSWTLQGDILAYYLEQNEPNSLGKTYGDLATNLGTTESSLKARIQNVRNVLDSNVGLSNPAKQTKEVVTYLEKVKNNYKVKKDFDIDLKNFLMKII